VPSPRVAVADGFIMGMWKRSRQPYHSRVLVMEFAALTILDLVDFPLSFHKRRALTSVASRYSILFLKFHVFSEDRPEAPASRVF
jgi:hypothetical protein